jgi:ketosteroid isomerase-like protein
VREEEARDLLQRWWDVWADGDVDVLDALVADPYVRHTAAGTETISLAEYKRRLVEYLRVLHSATTTVDDVAVSGDTIWSRATSRGVNIESGERALMTWLMVHRVVDGRFAEVWSVALSGVDWER